jgi:polyferredoxin
MNKKNKRQWIRHGVQIVFFMAVLSVVLKLIGDASLHAICPFGGVASVYKLITEGSYVQKIHVSSLILMYAVLFMSLLFGPVFCGWACPLGTVQEFIGKLGRKLFGKRYNNMIPEKIDRVLRYLRYLVFILVIYNTAASAKLVFQNYDPYFALFNLFTSEVAITAYIALGVTLLLSLFVERPFCKYACPYGAFLGTFNLVRFFKIRRKKDTCISCGLCDKACPMNIKVSSKNRVFDHQCISCMKCTSDDACPVKDTVEFSLRGGKGK